jgi:hypothetical protein
MDQSLSAQGDTGQGKVFTVGKGKKEAFILWQDIKLSASYWCRAVVRIPLCLDVFNVFAASDRGAVL